MTRRTRPPARHIRAQRIFRGADTAATLFDDHAEHLYDYAATMLGDGQDAAEVVHDTLVDATRRARRLRDHSRLTAWLYAGARLRLLKSHQRPMPEFDRSERADVEPLLRGVFGRLDHPEHETLLLTLRHGLDHTDLAAVFGLSVRAAAHRIDTTIAQATEALAAQQTQRAGPCAAGRDVAEHVLGCAGCLRRGHLTLADLLTAPAVHPMPARLRGWVLHTATDPELDVYRADIAARGGALTEAGLPRQPDAPARLVRRSVRATVRAATGSGTAMLTSAVMVSGALGIALLPIVHAPAGTPLATSQSPGSGHGGTVRLAAAPAAPAGNRPAHAGHAAAPFAPLPHGTAPQIGDVPPPTQPPAPVPGQPAPSPEPPAPAPAPTTPTAPTPPPWIPPIQVAPAPASPPGLAVTTPGLPVQVSLTVLPPLKVAVSVRVPIIDKILTALLPSPHP